MVSFCPSGAPEGTGVTSNGVSGRKERVTSDDVGSGVVGACVSRCGTQASLNLEASLGRVQRDLEPLGHRGCIRSTPGGT